MQKMADVSTGSLYIVNKDTGEMMAWDDIAEISLDDLKEEGESLIRGLQDALMDTLPDDKVPNPIYIPKHIQHRKKGRR